MNNNVSILLTDLYQLNMLQGYYEQGMEDTAVFEFFVRKMPKQRGFLVAAGLETVLQYLETMSFTKEELDWLYSSGMFKKGFIDYLEKMRFTGDVHAMQEGTIFFPDEPILRVTAPLPQAQLVESRIINLIHFQTLIASKAIRMVIVGRGKALVDFGMRRSHGAEAAILAARASYIVGFSGTATVLAKKLYGIPIYGTMAHSFVMAHDDEKEAFEHFAKARPDNAVLIIDTYDTERAAHKVVELAPRLRAEGIEIRGVRLDSGDLAQEAKSVRSILDRGGLYSVKIFASGNLDEYILEDIIKAGAPIDGFGIGTRLDTSSDVPYLDCAYKLQEYAGKVRRKRSRGKATLPGRKQVYRYYDKDGKMSHDLLTTEDDKQDGRALIEPVMIGGKRLSPPRSLEDIRAYTSSELSLLPDRFKKLKDHPIYPVKISERIEELVKKVDREFR